MDDAYTIGKLNADLYAQWPAEFADMFESCRYFFEQYPPTDDMSVLDVGGACGAVGNVLEKHFGVRLDYTCTDVDPRALERGRELFPRFRFVESDLFAGLGDQQFDIVMVMGWFAQMSDWKRLLIECARHSRRFVNIGINVRLDGTTVTDPDVSYVYYLDSGKRVVEITHNLFELLNFASIHEIEAKKLSFYGYRSKNPTSAFRPLPRAEQIQGNLLIEKFVGQAPARIGGISNQSATVMAGKYEAFRPEVEIIIDGERVDA